MKHEFMHIPEPLGLFWLNEGTVSRKGDLPRTETKIIQRKYRKKYCWLNAKKRMIAILKICASPVLARKSCKGKMGNDIQ